MNESPEYIAEKERLTKWLKDAITIAHEVAGVQLLCSSSTIELPIDICKELLKKGVFEYDGERRYYLFLDHWPNILQVFVRPTRNRKSKRLQIIIHG